MVNYPFDYVAIFEDNAGYLHGFFSTGSKWVSYLPITEKGGYFARSGGYADDD